MTVEEGTHPGLDILCVAAEGDGIALHDDSCDF